MKVMVINAGSSSLKYQLIETDGEKVLCKGGVEKIGIGESFIVHNARGVRSEIKREVDNHSDALELVFECVSDAEIGVVADAGEIDAFGHRFVHCGEAFDKSVRVDEGVLAKLEEVVNLAPLHNPANLECIRICAQRYPHAANVAVFDTAFHSTMPKYAGLYAIPYEDYEKYKIRKYGFHGTSHKYVSGVAIDYLESKGLSASRIVTCHLGNGSSVTAIKDGKCIDTSMGMTPLDGVPMGTRSGSIDPSVVGLLCEYKGMSAGEAVDYLNKECGLKGVSGVNSDARAVCAAADKGNERAKLALDMVAYSVKKFIGAYAAALNGLDCVVLTGGIGENSVPVRERILTGLDGLGIKFDKSKNVRGEGAVTEIQAEGSAVKVLIIPTDEELMIARETAALA